MVRNAGYSRLVVVERVEFTTVEQRRHGHRENGAGHAGVRRSVCRSTR